MIEDIVSGNIAEFGMAVAFILYLVYDKFQIQTKMMKSIENNTIALNKLSGVIVMLQHEHERERER